MNTEESIKLKDRKNERGAALIMALLISFLLLVAAAGLLLETSVNTANVTDATSEQQAYNAAESGIQSVVNALRYKCTQAVSAAGGCRVKPNPLYDTTKAEFHKDNWITYIKALTPSLSNDANDASTAPRLSRIIGYTGTGAAAPVKLGQPGDAYIQQTGYAYNLSISDPDNTGSLISYYTTGVLFNSDTGDSTQKTYPVGGGANSVVFKYNPVVVSNLNVPGGTLAPTNFGNFSATVTGTGAAVPDLMRFEIAVRMTIPFPATRYIRGFIQPTTAGTLPKIIFDSQTYDLRGTDISLNFSGLTGYPAWTGTPAPAMRTTGAQPYGYEARLSAGTNVLSGTISPPQPARLMVRSTGFGPRGSVKQLEAIIQNNYFNGLGAPATVTLVGPPSTVNPATNFTFNPGNSNAMLYSGEDVAVGSSDIIPPVGVTGSLDMLGNDPNLEEVEVGFGNRFDNVIGVPSNVTNELPLWLSSVAEMEKTIQELYNTARNSYDATNLTGRVFTGTDPTSWGDNATGTGITFCDGDCELGPISGGGILVVTGQLTLRGNFDWHGLIIVTGQGGVLRSGGGNGTIEGNIVVAPYVDSLVGGNPAFATDFLSPQWETSGGGNSTLTYNSDNQNSGLGAISNVVLGVVEK